MTDPLTPSQQARILRWALERGLLTRADVGLSLNPDAATLSEADLAGLFEALARSGRLEGLAAAALMDDRMETAVASADRPQALGEPAEPMDPEDLEAFALPPGGRYLPLAFLGDGGMGRVYKAFDQQLKRVVALKFLKRLEGGPAARFLQEGRAQARMEHPNICNIYSVDEFEGQPYLSMRFIKGPTLKAALPRLTLEQKVRIILQVAQALHSCHRQGILHRDIKPSNIMLEVREDGEWWPYLMDFGLARELDDPGMTLPGMILGTPVYCSPEQLQGRGAEVDRRSDVYSLGATLYECLSGEPPFPSQGSLVDLVRRVTEEDPPPLRQRIPNLPRDLQTIVLKTLEKEPNRRYASARALGEDLQRFLDGDPILAHSDSIAYRLTKRFRKNKALTLVASVSLMAVTAFAGFGVVMAWRGRVQSASIRTYGREAEYMEGILLKAYTLPLHDVRTEQTMVRQRLDLIQASMGKLGSWSLPAAHQALGRGYLALDRLEDACRELELASGGAPLDPDNALALGLTLTRLYQAELEGLRGKALEDKKKDTELVLRKPALACLRQARGAHQDGPAYVEGMLALVEERYEDAIAKARDYQRLAPWAYEAWLLEAQALQALAARNSGEGDFPRAQARLQEAGVALLQARNVARSAPLAYLGELQRRMLAFQMALDRGNATLDVRDGALQAAELCLTANPEDWKALSYRAAIHRRWGALLLSRGQDPSPSLDAAIAASEEGIRHHPAENPLWNNLGTALRNRAEWEISQGQDPTATLARAVDALTRALTRPQFKDWLLDSIGCCHGILARYQLDHGADPSLAVKASVEALNQAMALKPWVGHVTTLGGTLQDLAFYLRMVGRDPMPVYEDARKAYDSALQLNGHSYQAHLGMAGLLMDRAETRLDATPVRTDLGADLQQASLHLDAALGLAPGLASEIAPAVARCRALEALASPPDSKERPRAVQAARAALEKARALAAGRVQAALPMAQGWLLVQRADPRSGAAAQGLSALRPALAQRPWDAQAAFTRSRLLALAGKKAEAEKVLAGALALNPNLGFLAKRLSGPVLPR